MSVASAAVHVGLVELVVDDAAELVRVVLDLFPDVKTPPPSTRTEATAMTRMSTTATTADDTPDDLGLRILLCHGAKG